MDSFETRGPWREFAADDFLLQFRRFFLVPLFWQPSDHFYLPTPEAQQYNFHHQLIMVNDRSYPRHLCLLSVSQSFSFYLKNLCLLLSLCHCWLRGRIYAVYQHDYLASLGTNKSSQLLLDLSWPSWSRWQYQQGHSWTIARFLNSVKLLLPLYE